jgi:glycosyltransferase involved in cell wall biosynthesis
MTPSISVIIPLYNKRGRIARAVQSALSQTLRDCEVIVVDDGSTDGSAAELDQYRADPRLRIVRQSNAGVSVARNRGLREMRSGLGAFLDADDVFLPGHLESLAALAQRFPEAGLLGTAFYTVLPDGTRMKHSLETAGAGMVDDFFALSYRAFGIFNASSACVRRSAVERAGGFLEGVSIGEDLEFWARVALQFPVAYDPQPSALYYLWTSSSAMESYRWRPDVPVADMIQRALETGSANPKLGSSAADYAAWILLKHAAAGIVRARRREVKQLLRHSVFASSRLSMRRALVWTAANCAPDVLLRTYLGLRNWQARRSAVAASDPNRSVAGLGAAGLNSTAE